MSRKGRHQAPSYNGVLPVLKPAGPTSHDVVDIARRALGQREVGHTGTLDPAATGLLLLCLGSYTKLSSYLTGHDKTYEGTFVLGASTDTDDVEGALVSVSGKKRAPSAAALAREAKKLTGPIDQMPPRYSAIKVGGKKLYEYARSGEAAAVAARSVLVKRLEVGKPVAGTLPEALAARPAAGVTADGATAVWRAAFVAEVSAGTYIRALARDLGRALGYGGYLENLTRTHIGKFDVSAAMSLELLRKSPERANDFMLRGAACIDEGSFPVLTLQHAFEGVLISGRPVHDRQMTDAVAAAAAAHERICAIAAEDGRLLAMAQAMRPDALPVRQSYVTPFKVAFRAVRVFPNGLK